MLWITYFISNLLSFSPVLCCWSIILRSGTPVTGNLNKKDCSSKALLLYCKRHVLLHCVHYLSVLCAAAGRCALWHLEISAFSWIPIPIPANIINYIWMGQIYVWLNICLYKHSENKFNAAQRCICKIHKPLHEGIYVGIVCDLLTYVFPWFCNCTSFPFI